MLNDLLTLHYQRDHTGLIDNIIEVRKDDTGAPVSDQRWDYAYDGLKRLASADLKSGAGYDDVVRSYAYTYSRNGNRLSKTVDDDGDGPAAEQTTTYSYNALDQLTSDGATTYHFDRFGRQWKEIEGSGPESVVRREYLWSVDDRLLGAKFFGAGGSLTNTAAYTYDHAGTRTQRAVTAAVPEAPAAPSHTNYLTDYGNPSGYSQTLSESSAAGAPYRHYFYGPEHTTLAQRGAGESEPGLSAPLDPADPASDPLYAFHNDHLGTPRALTASSGAFAPGSNFAYSPYGNLYSGSATLTPARFTGQYADTPLANQYHRARWLSINSDKWLSMDAYFDFSGNFGNGYSYVGLNPIGAVDCTGNLSLTEQVIVGGILGGLVGYNLGLYTELLFPDLAKELGGNLAVKGMLIGIAIGMWLPLWWQAPGVTTNQQHLMNFLFGFASGVATSEQQTVVMILLEGFLSGLIAMATGILKAAITREITKYFVLLVWNIFTYLVTEVIFNKKIPSLNEISYVIFANVVGSGFDWSQGDDELNHPAGGPIVMFNIINQVFPKFKDEFVQLIEWFKSLRVQSDQVP